MDTKQCKKCDNIKFLIFFRDKKNGKSGKDSYCMDCRKAYDKALAYGKCF